MKKIKTIVNKHLATMKPFVIRDKGGVPPMLFFQFKTMDPGLEELNITQEDEVIAVEKGFFVPMTTIEVMANQDVFLKYMGMIMASLQQVGLVGDLESVTIALSGKAKVRPLTPEGRTIDELDVFIVSGVNKNEEVFTTTKELRAKIGLNSMSYDLVDSDVLEEVDEGENLFLGNFFELYNASKARILEDLENMGMLNEAHIDKKENPAEFAAELLEAAAHATVLASGINNQE